MKDKVSNKSYPGFLLTALILGALLLVSAVSQADIAGDENFQRIFRLIYHQRFTEAEREINSPGNFTDPLQKKVLLLDLKWWKALSSEKNPDFSAFEEELAENVTLIKEGTCSHKLFEMIILTYSLRLSAKKGQIFSMLGHMYKINQMIQHFDDSDLEGHDRDIYQIYKAVFQVGKSKLILFNSQLKNQGMQTLESYLDSPNIVVRTVAHYSLAKIYFEIDKSFEKSGFYFQKLCLMYPDNKIFTKSLKECRI